MAERGRKPSPEMASLLAGLRSAREAKGWVLKDLAKRLNVSLAAAGNYEIGTRRPGQETAQRWVAAVGESSERLDEFMRIAAQDEVRKILDRNRGRLSQRDIEMITQMIRRSWGQA